MESNKEINNSQNIVVKFMHLAVYIWHGNEDYVWVNGR